ncbi:hypothetical protein PJL18_04159 [Paenarthrobacter nicotinovorans]|nr:hypothetical protein [Paenarthrobacter nicotinovorans]
MVIARPSRGRTMPSCWKAANATAMTPAAAKVTDARRCPMGVRSTAVTMLNGRKTMARPAEVRTTLRRNGGRTMGRRSMGRDSHQVLSGPPTVTGPSFRARLATISRKAYVTVVHSTDSGRTSHCSPMMLLPAELRSAISLRRASTNEAAMVSETAMPSPQLYASTKRSLNEIRLRL